MAPGLKKKKKTYIYAEEDGSLEQEQNDFNGTRPD